MDGKLLPDLNNHKFVDERVKIKEAIPTVRTTFSSSSFAKYLKSAITSKKVLIFHCQVGLKI